MSGATCRGCGAPLVWGITEAGKKVPLDPPEKEAGEGLRAGEPGDLDACLDLLRKLEWGDNHTCPGCGHFHPGRADEWHGPFRHSDECELARLIGSELRGDVFMCDCYVAGRKGCLSAPLFDGRHRPGGS